MQEIKDWVLEYIHPRNIAGLGRGKGICEDNDWETIIRADIPFIRVDVPYLTDETKGRVSGACVWYEQKDTCFPRLQTAARILENIECTGCGQPLMVNEGN